MENDDYTSCSKVPEFNAMILLQQKMSQKKVDGKFDPHGLMVKRHSDGNAREVQKWPEEDVNALETFCKKMGVVGFNCGNMSPLAALAFLKQKLGVVEDGPKSEGYGPNYPYSEAMKKKILLKG